MYLLFKYYRMYYCYANQALKKHKKKKKKFWNSWSEYHQVMNKRIAYVNERIMKEKEEKAKLQFF